MIDVTNVLSFIHQLNASQDAFILGVPAMVYAVKVMARPSQVEAVTLARIMVPIIIFLTKRLEDWMVKHPNSKSLKETILNMKNNSIFGGPVG